MRTKFSKSFVTTFFPVGDDIRAVVADWVNYLRTEKLWGLDDPLFPATKVAVGDRLPVCGGWAGPQALEQRRPDPDDLQGSVCGGRACRTSTRIAFGRRWRCSVASFATRQRNTRRGRRIWVMSTC